MDYEILRFGEDDTDVKDGIITWEQDTGNWSFKTNNTQLANALREIGYQGYVRRRESEETEDGIFELHLETTPREDMFLDALRDHLTMNGFRVIEFTPLDE